MIGVFRPPKNKPKKTGELYKSVYCSVCSALKEKYGLFFTLFICHEIVQMIISMLQYCHGMNVEKCRCPICYSKKKDIIRHKVFEVAADSCLLLVWFKIMDSIHDKERILFRMLYFAFRKKIQRITETSTDLKLMVNRYLKVIDSNDMDKIMSETGIAAQAIYSELLSYTEINEVHKESILPVADLYGKIIALADPVLDFEEDMKKHKKSPLSLENREHYTQELFELMNYGKSLVLKLEKENKVSLYFQNTYALSCYNIENKLNK